MTAPEPLRVVLADDAALLREGIASLLSTAGFEVVAQVGDGPSLVEAVRSYAPDLVVSDIRMPPHQRLEGLEAAARIQSDHPGVGILLLSQHAEVRHLSGLLDDARAGFGYLLKDRVVAGDAFVSAVRRVSNGGFVLDPEIVTLLLARRRQRSEIERLTAREYEVLAGMAEGASNSALGRDLDLSMKTVEAHVRSIFVKLGLPEGPDENRRVKAVLAYLRGL